MLTLNFKIVIVHNWYNDRANELREHFERDLAQMIENGKLSLIYEQGPVRAFNFVGQPSNLTHVFTINEHGGVTVQPLSSK